MKVRNCEKATCCFSEGGGSRHIKDTMNSASLIRFLDTVDPAQFPGMRPLDSFLTKLMGRWGATLHFRTSYSLPKKARCPELEHSNGSVELRLGQSSSISLNEPPGCRFLNNIIRAYMLTLSEAFSKPLFTYHWWKSSLKQKRKIAPWRQKFSKYDKTWHWGN